MIPIKDASGAIIGEGRLSDDGQTFEGKIFTGDDAGPYYSFLTAEEAEEQRRELGIIRPSTFGYGPDRPTTDDVRTFGAP